mgnify:CR=1 FL=1
MTRYYCNGFDINNAFGHRLGDMFLNELKDRKSIVYIPGGADKMQKVREIYVPAFTEHFKNVGIEFETSTIITPCSEEYPEFHIEEGLNLDGISIYPHNNTNDQEYPDTLVVGDEIYKKEDLIKVANQYGDYYLLQDYVREDGLTDVSLIRTTNGSIGIYTENDGKIWTAKNSGIVLSNKIEKNNVRKI